MKRRGKGGIGGGVNIPSHPSGDHIGVGNCLQTSEQVQRSETGLNEGMQARTDETVFGGGSQDQKEKLTIFGSGKHKIQRKTIVSTSL